MFQKLSIRNFSFKNVKNFILPCIFALAGFLVINMELNFGDLQIFGFSIIYWIFAFIPLLFGVCLIDALIIKEKLKILSKKALSISLVANFITIFLVYFVLKFDLLAYLPSPEGELTEISVFFLLLFLSVIIFKIIVLFFYFRQEGWFKIFRIGLVMNVKSYLFFIILVPFYVISAPIIFVAIYYYLFNLFRPQGEDEAFLKRKKFLRYFIICVVIFLIFSLIILSPNSRGKGKDARRTSDIRQISTACEMYYSDIENEKYPVYHNFAALKNRGIGEYMKPVAFVDDQRIEFPDDPRGGDVHYIWIDNTGKGEDQYFCVYAKLEDMSADTWVVGSEKGHNYNATREPTGLGDACW